MSNHVFFLETRHHLSAEERGWRIWGGGGGGGEHDIPGERRAYHLSSVEYKGRNVEY